MSKKVKKPEVSISNGNRKMGRIKSVSLPPILTCAKNCTCAVKCYAVKMCRIYKSVKKAYERNLEILTSDPEYYWNEVDEVLFTNRFFRFHVSGDIPNYEYFVKMVEVIKNNPWCECLAFTKQYDIVNKAVANGVEIPKNFRLWFSEWEGMKMDNPYNFPVAHVVFKKQKPEPHWNMCTGNCLECARKGSNCWNKECKDVAFKEH